MLGGYDDLMFQMGVLDENEKAFFESQTDIAISDINAGNFIDAFKVNKGTVTIVNKFLTSIRK